MNEDFSSAAALATPVDFLCRHRIVSPYTAAQVNRVFSVDSIFSSPLLRF